MATGLAARALAAFDAYLRDPGLLSFQAAHDALEAIKLRPDPLFSAGVRDVKERLDELPDAEAGRKVALLRSCGVALLAIDRMLPVEESVAYAVSLDHEEAAVSLQPQGANAVILYKVSITTRHPWRYLRCVYDTDALAFVSPDAWVAAGAHTVAGEPRPSAASPTSAEFRSYAQTHAARNPTGPKPAPNPAPNPAPKPAATAIAPNPAAPPTQEPEAQEPEAPAVAVAVDVAAVDVAVAAVPAAQDTPDEEEPLPPAGCGRKTPDADVEMDVVSHEPVTSPPPPDREEAPLAMGMFELEEPAAAAAEAKILRKRDRDGGTGIAGIAARKSKLTTVSRKEVLTKTKTNTKTNTKIAMTDDDVLAAEEAKRVARRIRDAASRRERRARDAAAAAADSATAVLWQGPPSAGFLSEARPRL